jgi:hypothetical protein
MTNALGGAKRAGNTSVIGTPFLGRTTTERFQIVQVIIGGHVGKGTHVRRFGWCSGRRSVRVRWGRLCRCITWSACGSSRCSIRVTAAHSWRLSSELIQIRRHGDGKGVRRRNQSRDQQEQRKRGNDNHFHLAFCESVYWNGIRSTTVFGQLSPTTQAAYCKSDG